MGHPAPTQPAHLLRPCRPSTSAAQSFLRTGRPSAAGLIAVQHAPTSRGRARSCRSPPKRTRGSFAAASGPKMVGRQYIISNNSSTLRAAQLLHGGPFTPRQQLQQPGNGEAASDCAVRNSSSSSHCAAAARTGCWLGAHYQAQPAPPAPAPSTPLAASKPFPRRRRPAPAMGRPLRSTRCE